VPTDSPDVNASSQSDSRDALRDRRLRPQGVLPRHLQTWLMMALAAAMLLIIFFSGRPQPPKRTAADGPLQPSAALSPDRLKKYQEQLTEQEARLRQELAESQAAAAAAQNQPQPDAGMPEQKPADPIADEQKRRQYSSLFAENVAFTRRSAGAPVRLLGEQPSPSDRQEPAGPALPASYPQSPAPTASATPTPSAPVASPAPDAQAARAAQDAKTASPCGSAATRENASRCLVEGTVIEAVLTNRLDGSFSGPVNAMVTSPVYSADRQTVLIPEGSRVLGTAAPVQAFGESRLAVRFHRLVLPSGASVDLDQFPALNQRGDAGLKDEVSRHYLQLFGASAAIGALSGLAQFSTRSASSADYGFSDAFGQGLGGSTAASGARILDRFLNVLPTITIREGHRLNIYLTADLFLPG